MRSPLLRTPSASLARSMSGRRSHLLFAWFRLRACRRQPLRACDLDAALPDLEEGLGRGGEMLLFPHDLIDDFLGQSWFMTWFLQLDQGVASWDQPPLSRAR